MKNILLLSAAAITVLIAACSGSTEQVETTDPQGPFELSGKRRVILPDHFYKQMTGDIENVTRFGIEMQRKDSVLFGRCVFYGVDSERSVQFEGTIDTLAGVKIKGIPNEHNGLPGIFIGEFTSDSTLEGKWMDKEGGKEEKFTCKDHYREGTALLVLKNKSMSSGNCGKVGRGTRCSFLSFTYPVVVNWKDTAAQRKINESIFSALLDEGDQKDLKTMMRGFLADTSKNPPGSYRAEHYKVLYDSYNILSLLHVSEYYSAGAAHPMYDHIPFSYDLKTGSRITLDDLLKPGYRARLNIVAEQVFRNEKNESLQDPGRNTPNNKFELTSSFAITEEGLLFIINPYETGSFALGASRVLVPYHLIKDLLKKESLLPYHFYSDGNTAELKFR
jgi:hypothetical protein